MGECFLSYLFSFRFHDRYRVLTSFRNRQFIVDLKYFCSAREFTLRFSFFYPGVGIYFRIKKSIFAAVNGFVGEF